LTASAFRRSRTAMLALALSMATAGALLALSPQAMAQAHSAACTSSVTAHPKRGAHACTRAAGTSSSRKSKTHARSKAKGHHSKHAKKHKRKAKAKAKAKKHATSAAKSPTPAVCEDGSAPVNDGGGVFTCADESEPMCSNGSTPVLSSNRASLVCGVNASGSGSTEATCEDGSAPVRASDGSFFCDDESQPVCEDGSTPVVSSSGLTLVCAGESSDSGANEVGCEGGSLAVQASDGSYSCVGSSEPECEGTSVPTLSSERWTPLCDVTEGDES